VLFPHPDGPIIETTVLDNISIFIPFNTCLFP
jgi:hypothetical protein